MERDIRNSSLYKYYTIEGLEEILNGLDTSDSANNHMITNIKDIIEIKRNELSPSGGKSKKYRKRSKKSRRK